MRIALAAPTAKDMIESVEKSWPADVLSESKNYNVVICAGNLPNPTDNYSVYMMWTKRAVKATGKGKSKSKSKGFETEEMTLHFNEEYKRRKWPTDDRLEYSYRTLAVLRYQIINPCCPVVTEIAQRTVSHNDTAEGDSDDVDDEDDDLEDDFDEESE